jgi:quercetin dioxygenase-like cupin family protein
MRIAPAVLLTLLLAGGLGAQEAPPAPSWGPAPPFLPAGARIAVLAGDPGSTGVYTIRLEFPAGYVVPPHAHPTDESVTVISGSMRLGMGDTVDLDKAMRLTVGGFITAPATMNHFAVAIEKSVVQIHGEGPFAITYVNPNDDPRNASTP